MLRGKVKRKLRGYEDKKVSALASLRHPALVAGSCNVAHCVRTTAPSPNLGEGWGEVKKAAFTLAEVLITLGIIGVVAAMTLPSLINKQRSYVLHKQFLKSYSNLSQAILLMKNDLGIENLQKEYATYDYENNIYPNANEFYENFGKYMKVIKEVEPYPIKNYTGDKDTSSYTRGNDNPKPYFVLNDGSSVGRFVNNFKISFWVDVNGPKKAPNRYGFDVFEFMISGSNDAVVPVKQEKLYTEEELEDLRWPDYLGLPCSKKSKQGLNGMGCSWFAVNNVNPDDETKKYWDSLPW